MTTEDRFSAMDAALTAVQSEWATLFAQLIPDIGDDYRASDGPDDGVPGMQVTIGATLADDGTLSWSYQTGDNSFTGGAYGHPHWAVVYLYRDSDPAAAAEAAASQIGELIAGSMPLSDLLRAQI